jgi:translation initiation factor IF-2
MRLYHLARELAVPIRTLLQEAEAGGIGVASHMSPIDGEEASILRERLGTNGDAVAIVEEVATEPAPVESEVTEPVTSELIAPEAETVEAPPEVIETTVVAQPVETPSTVETPVAPAPTLPPVTPKPVTAETTTPEIVPARPVDKPAARKTRRAKVRKEIEEALVDRSTPDAVEEKPVVPAKIPIAPPPKKKIHKKVVKIVRRRERGRSAPRGLSPEMAARRIDVTTPISLKDFSQALGIKANTLIRKLMENGVFARINAMLDEETVEYLAIDFGRDVHVRRGKDLEVDLVEAVAAEESSDEDLVTRPPIVTFLGHVDHGKTSLMDAIRETNVTAGESGGITQHIGAYRVETQEGHTVVFLDTPGHEAFTAMRARGANITDICVLVVAADDGVMPQTEEAINHAQAAGVPIIVALNKSDRPDADSMRVKQQLTNFSLIPEDWGGETIAVETSATTGQGIKELLEYITLQSELLELKANPALRARGTVIEAELTEGRGVVTTLLVQDGTLRRGDLILCGKGEGKVRAIRSDQDEILDEAGPATPVAVTGLSEVPEAGDEFFVVENASKAKALAATRQKQARVASLAERQHVSLENIFDRMKGKKVEEVRVILKADVKGSLEAIKEKLIGLGNEEVKVKLLHAAVGGINESDVILADASDAVILGFHILPEERARLLAVKSGIEIRLYHVIYELISEIREAMENRLAPDRREKVIGHAEVRALFKVSRMGTIAGCYVRDGFIRKTAKVRLARDSKVVVNDSDLASLKRFKDDAREVKEGLECGLRFEGFDDIKEGDTVECYEIEEIKRTLDSV